jgi:hypothetical protein
MPIAFYGLQIVSTDTNELSSSADHPRNAKRIELTHTAFITAGYSTHTL